jgi:hypothetical protein
MVDVLRSLPNLESLHLAIVFPYTGTSQHADRAYRGCTLAYSLPESLFAAIADLKNLRKLELPVMSQTALRFLSSYIRTLRVCRRH